MTIRTAVLEARFLLGERKLFDESIAKGGAANRAWVKSGHKAAIEQHEKAGIKITTLTATTIARMGKVVTDEKGWVLYRFDKDTADPANSTCVATCAQIWPPVLAEGNPTLNGLLASKVGTLQRADGGTQLTLNGWPLYRYIGDTKPGQWKGQAVGGTWWVIAPDGTKNLTCVPSGTPTAVAPPASPAAGAAGGAGDTGGGYTY